MILATIKKIHEKQLPWQTPTCFFSRHGVMESRQRHWKRTFLNSEFHSSSAPAHSAKLVSSSMLKPQHRTAQIRAGASPPQRPCSRA